MTRINNLYDRDGVITPPSLPRQPFKRIEINFKPWQKSAHSAFASISVVSLDPKPLQPENTMWPSRSRSPWVRERAGFFQGCPSRSAGWAAALQRAPWRRALPRVVVRTTSSERSCRATWAIGHTNQSAGQLRKSKNKDKQTQTSIGKEINWDWFAGLVSKRESQIQKEPFAAGEWGCR